MQVEMLEGHFSVAFSPDGSRLALESGGSTVNGKEKAQRSAQFGLPFI